MSYTVSWDGPSAQEPDRGYEIEVSTVAELDEVLDRVTAQAAAEKLSFAVQVHDHEAPGSVMIGVGHTERSFVDWLVPDGYHEYGYEQNLPIASAPVAFDIYGEWHEHPAEKLRTTPATAREAARQYVRTGQRPTCVEWAAE